MVPNNCYVTGHTAYIGGELSTPEVVANDCSKAVAILSIFLLLVATINMPRSVFMFVVFRDSKILLAKAMDVEMRVFHHGFAKARHKQSSFFIRKVLFFQ